MRREGGRYSSGLLDFHGCFGFSLQRKKRQVPVYIYSSVVNGLQVIVSVGSLWRKPGGGSVSVIPEANEALLRFILQKIRRTRGR